MKVLSRSGVYGPVVASIVLRGLAKTYADCVRAVRGIAMMSQSLALYPHLSVYDNVAFGMVLRRRPRAELDRQVRDVAAMLDLTVQLRRRPDRLSGGQRQQWRWGGRSCAGPRCS